MIGNNTNFLAIDLGASTGRAILGQLCNNRLTIREINRFDNPIIKVNGRDYWNLLYFYSMIISSLRSLKSENIPIRSIGIDTWGVDFVCFGKDGEPLRTPYCYRDTRFLSASARYFKHQMLPKEVYKKTGIQLMHFNTLFQLAALHEDAPALYPAIDKVLFLPDALSYMLTGKMIAEYTIASTSQMLNPYSRRFDDALIHSIGLEQEHFPPIVFPGTNIGQLNQTVEDLTGFNDVHVVAVAGHDTASAVLATPASDGNFAYLSSGTWSLMGIESEKPVITDDTFELNLTNEGGADGSIRLLKNICGMWLIEQCKKEWDKKQPVSYDEIVAAAQNAKPFRCFINPDSPCFSSPVSMIHSIKAYCEQTGQRTPESMGEIARCIYESLAFRYRQVLEDLQKMADFPIEVLHVIGGGSQNNLLNQWTANSTGKTVKAGPAEATAMGNLLLQAKAAGLVADKNEIRQIVRNSTTITSFHPTDFELWDENYPLYLNFLRNI